MGVAARQGGECVGLALKLGEKGLYCISNAWPDRAWVSLSLANWWLTGLSARVLPLQESPAPPVPSVPQVLGLVRVPLYTQKDRVGGFPNFLSNAFVSTAKYQLLFALKVLNMMPSEKLAEALASATEKQKKALEKLLPASS